MSKSEILFHARRLGQPVTVTPALDVEIARLAGRIDAATDMLEFWRLIAIRCDADTAVHAVGWRILWAQPYITAALTTYDKELGAIRTGTGDQFSLGVPGPVGLDPELRAFIARALRSWGFSHVRSITPRSKSSALRRRARRARHRPVRPARPNDGAAT